MAAAPSLCTTKRARWHRLTLEVSPEALWQRLAPAVRRAIRHAQRAGVEVRPMAGDRDREAFHRLHVALRKQKYRLLAQPPHFFAAIERHFQAVDGWHALAAYLGERMIAATIYLRWREGLYYKFNASALDSLHVRPNNLLVWAGMALARSLGCRFLDLGPSDDDQPGLIRFKRGFDAEEQALHFLRWTPPHWREPRLDSRRVLSAMTRALTAPEVPDDVTAQAGAALYRFFA